jgi:hypothetical protein
MYSTVAIIAAVLASANQRSSTLVGLATIYSVPLPIGIAGRVAGRKGRRLHRSAWWVSTKNDRRCDPLAHVGRFADPLRS